MNWYKMFVVGFLVCGVVSADNVYVIEVDGQKIVAPRISEDISGDSFREGDIVFIRDIPLRLAKPGNYVLSDRIEEEGCLYLLGPGDQKTVIGLKIGNIESAVRLSDKEIRSLWGIAADSDADLDRKILSAIDPSRTAVSFSGPCSLLQSLPENLECLFILYLSGPDFLMLNRFTKLRYFAIQSASSIIPLECLRNSREVRYLKVGADVSVGNWKTLACLKELRVLDLSGRQDMDDISFLCHTRKLQSLNLAGSKVGDLYPLSDLQDLIEINATNAPVSILPQGALPALKRVKLMGSQVDPKMLSDFEQTHPQCIVYWGWNRTVPKVLSETTSIYVVADDKYGPIMASINQPSEIKRIVEGIEFDPDEAPNGTMCLISGYLTFCNKDRLLESFGLDCTLYFRWDNGCPRGVELTQDCLDVLSREFASKGLGEIFDPKDMAEAAGKRNQMEHAFKQLIALLPSEIASQIQKECDAKEAVRRARRASRGPGTSLAMERVEYEQIVKDVLNRQIPDEVKRSRLYFQLFGKNLDVQNLILYMLKSRLSEIPQIKKEQAIRQGAVVQEELLGIARWMLKWQGWKEIDRGLVDELLPRLVTVSIDKNDNRIDLIYTLGNIRTEEAVLLLRQILSGTLSVKTTLKEVYPRAEAGLMLGQIGDMESVDLLKKAIKESEGLEKKKYEEALQIMTEEQVQVDCPQNTPKISDGILAF